MTKFAISSANLADADYRACINAWTEKSDKICKLLKLAFILNGFVQLHSSLQQFYVETFRSLQSGNSAF